MFSIRFFFLLILGFACSKVSASASNMRFTENKGQWNNNICFNAKLNFGNIYFEKNNFSFLLYEAKHGHESQEMEAPKGHFFQLHFIGANKNVRFTYSGTSDYSYNYFLGNDPSRWASNVKDFESITYRNLYHGIDLNAKGEGENFKYEYYVAPNANPNQILIKYDGVENLQIKNGNLVYSTSVSEIMELAPYSYQLINGKKIEVPSGYSLDETNATVSFIFPNGYNENHQLIIDPTLIFARLSQSTSDNFGFTATYDDQGRAYSGGIVFGASGTYPTTTGSFNENFNASTLNNPVDIGVSCYDGNTGALIYGTYIGGSGNELPNSMIVNNQGELVVLATTGSPSFPISNNAYDDDFTGGNIIDLTNNGISFSIGSDMAIFKLSNDGSALLASTFIGGNQNDGLNEDISQQNLYNGSDLHFNYGDAFRGEVIVDENDNIYVASSTNSNDFPSSGAVSSFQGEQDAVVFKLNSNLTTLLFSRYLGGSDDDAGYSMKIDGNGDLLVDGGTKSSDFPIIGNTLNPSYLGGESDGYVAKLNSNTGEIIASTFIGTDAYDQVYFVDLDEANNVYIVGQTLGDYPVESANYSEINGKQFIHKLSPDLTNTVYSTTFGSGGSNVDISPTALLVDVCERVYVSGWGGPTNTNRNPNSTNSNISNLSTTPDALSTQAFGGDFYFFVLDKNATGQLYGSFFGGNANEHVDGGTSRFDDQGIIYQAICAACGGNTTFPATSGFNNTSSSNNCNLGLVKLDIELPITDVALDANPTATGCIPLTVNFQSVLQDVTDIIWNLGDGSTSTLPNPIHTYNDTGTFNVSLIGTDLNSCNGSDTAFISVIASDDTLEVDVIDSLYFDCNTYDVYVSAPFEASAQYSWIMGDGTILTNHTNFVNHQYLNGGIFEIVLEITDNTKCESEGFDTMMVDFPPFVQAEIGTNNACVNTPIQMVNFSNPDAEIFQWDLGFGMLSNEFEPVVSFSNSGDFEVYLTVIDSGTCNLTSSDTAIITVTPPPSASFTLDSNYYIYPDLVAFNNFSLNFDDFVWHFGDGIIDSLQLEPEHLYQSIGELRPCLEVYNAGCADTICKNLFMDFIPLIGVPNAFSPNGDGINDFLKVEGLGIVKSNFKIYNRWGEIVFESNSIQETWDGNFKGIPQEMEVYTYVLNAVLLDDSNPVLKGNITLLR